MSLYNGYVSVSIPKSLAKLYKDCISFPLPEATLESLANFTLQRKNISVDAIIDKLLDLQKTFKYIFIDSGGYQSKVGRLHKGNYKEHFEIYFKLLENLPDNMFMFSLDFPPCMAEKFHADAIDYKASGELTMESYKLMAELNKNTDRVIVVTHFASSNILDAWYKVFNMNADKLRKFKYFATGMLNANYTNPKVISYYHGAKLFLKLNGIIPERFHYLGTVTLPLIKPMYEDKTLESRTFDATIKPFTGNLSLLKQRSDGLYELYNASFKSKTKYQIEYYIDLFSDYIDKSLIKKINETLDYHAKGRLNRGNIHYGFILQLHANLMKGYLLKQNKIYISPLDLGYNKQKEEELINSINTLDDFKKIIHYFDQLLN
jgi:hypothetical protein